MNNRQQKLNSKRKEAEVGSPQQPQIDGERAATLTQTQGEFSSGAADLQRKRIMAAMKFVLLDEALWDHRLDPTNKELPNLELYLWNFAPLLHCMPARRGRPATIFFCFRKEWIRLTEGSIAEAYNIMSPYDDAEAAAQYLTRGIRQFCKKYGQVSWVLPKILRWGVAR